MGIKRKPTHDEKLLIALYQEMLKKDKNVTVSEVQAEFNKRYGNK
jgi:hypothetical protein